MARGNPWMRLGLNAWSLGAESSAVIGLRAMKERNRQNASWSGRADANSISLTESGAGCSRAATLSRGR